MISVLNFTWNCQSVCKEAVYIPFCIPTNNLWKFQVLSILAKLAIINWHVNLFNFSHSSSYEVLSHCIKVPNITLRLSVLQERLIGLKKAALLMVTVYYSERMHTEISKGKRCMRWSPGQTLCKPPDIPSQWAHMGICSILSAMMCDTCKMLATREAHLSLYVQSFVVTQLRGHGAHVSLTSALWPRPPFPPNKTRCRESHCRDKLTWSNWYSMAQGLGHTKTGVHHTYSLVQGLRHTKILLPGRISHRIFQESVLNAGLSLECAGFKELRSAELTLAWSLTVILICFPKWWLMLSIIACAYSSFICLLWLKSPNFLLFLKIWLFIFFLSCKSSLYGLDTNHLLDILQVVSPSLWLVFSLLKSALKEQKVLILIKSNLLIFLFMILLFVSYPRNLSYTKVTDFLLCIFF